MVASHSPFRASGTGLSRHRAASILRYGEYRSVAASYSRCR